MSLNQNGARLAGARDRRRVSLCRTFQVSIEELWSALVEPDHIRAWFAPASLEPWVGGRIELKHVDGSQMMEGMVRVFEPPSVLEYDWDSPYETTIVRYELERDGSGTRLTLSERLLRDKVAVRRSAGWHHHLERLEAHLRGQASPISEERWQDLRERYEREIAALRAGDQSGRRITARS